MGFSGPVLHPSDSLINYYRNSSLVPDLLDHLSIRPDCNPNQAFWNESHELNLRLLFIRIIVLPFNSLDIVQHHP